MRNKIVIVIPAICLLMLGGKRNREILLEEYKTISEELVRIIDANPTAEGVMQAQDYLDSKKDSLKSKFAANGQQNSYKNVEDKFRVIVPGIQRYA